ncbi:MAG: fibronectin type III domain-containing protein [Mogibacterium sp.]|nr:fibronectin type III domain-containing protein [Mogibacterium sp.]
MKLRQRALALLLSFVMIVTYMPAIAFAGVEGTAEGDTPVAADVHDESNASEEEADTTDQPQAEPQTEDAGSDTAAASESAEQAAPSAQHETPAKTGGSDAVKESGQDEEPAASDKGSRSSVVFSEPVIERGTVSVESDNDELLMQYMQNIVSEESAAESAKPGLKRSKSVKRVDKLADKERAVYQVLAAELKNIANGSRTSTWIEVPIADAVEGLQSSYTAADLGVQSLVHTVVDEDGSEYLELTEDADIAVNELLAVDNNAVINALMADMPFDLYWYDKTAGYLSGWNFSSIATWSDDLGEYVLSFETENGDAAAFRFCFAVSEAYRGAFVETVDLGEDEEGNPETFDVYDTDAEKTQAPAAAAANASEIIASTAAQGLSDVDILAAYRDAICDRVSYNSDAAAPEYDGGYGDPWQMIYVFDNDETTNVVCEGYSKAFQFLCDNTDFADSSIECNSVTGQMVDKTSREDHMWNILHMNDGKNYIADVTNSDEDSAGQNGGLFISPALNGSVEDGYGYLDSDENGAADLTYVYDEDTRALFTDEELEMSMTMYEGAVEPGQEETIIPIQLDEVLSCETSEEKNYQIYSFTPEADGTYCFESNEASIPTFGATGYIENGEFYEDGRGFRDDINQNFRLYFDASAGETIYLKAGAYEFGEDGTSTFDVKVTTSSKVESIELSLVEPIQVCEHTHGGWSTDSEGNKMWEYYVPGFTDGDTLTVTDGNGSVVYTYSDGEFRSVNNDRISISWTSDQWDNGEWGVGTHVFTANYRGASTTLPVEITESPVKSVKFTPAEPKTYVEVFDGNTYTDWNNVEYTYYQQPYFRDGDMLTVDGTDYIFSEYSNQFVSDSGDVITSDDLEWLDSDQYQNHWGIGKHEFEFGYMGQFTSYPVEVIENPVKTIEYIPELPYIYYDGVDSDETITDEEGVDHCLYDTPYMRSGDRLIINGTDTYTYTSGEDEGEFIGPEGEYISPYDISFSSNQENGEYWELGNSNYVTVSYRGRTCTVPVAILEPEVHEISYQPVEDYILTENVDGWDEWDDEAGAEFFHYDVPYGVNGEILTVDGKEYTLRNGEYISADGERIDEDEVEFSTDQSYSNQWSIDDEGGHSVTISYRGNECTVPVVIEASPVTAIEFEPVKPIVFYEHVGGEWGESVSGDSDRYYYDISEFSVGDKLTVHKGDETQVYTYKYTPSGAAFVTADGGDTIDRWRVNAEAPSQDEGEGWQAGQEYEITISYMGASCTVTARVEANPVESIVYEPEGGAISIMANTNGEMYRNYFEYYPPGAQVGDKLTVTLASGDTTTYVYNEKDWGFTDGSGNVLDTQYLRFRYSGWQEEEWPVGSTHDCIVSYMNKECLIKVRITDNPVTGFSVHLENPLRIKDTAMDLIEHSDDEIYPISQIDGWCTDPWRGLFRTGDSITVKSTTGEQIYTLKEGNDYFDNGAGGKIYCYDIDYEMEGDWSVDGDPQVTMRYMGRYSDPVPVEVYPDPDHVHSMVHHDAVAPGCLTGGYAEYWYCSGCDRYYADADGQTVMARADAVLKATGHTWDKGEITKEATCGEDGVMTYTCTVCGATRTQSIPAGNHKWDEGEVTEPSTCHSMGTKTYTCLICGEHKTESLPLAPHAELKHVEAVEPTCTSYGNIEYWYCPDCSRRFSDANGENEIDQFELSPLPHTLVEHSYEAPTCEVDGHEAYWECSECGQIFSDANGENYIGSPEIVSAIGHKWGEWEQTQAPTCTEYGVETRVCSNDESHTETRTIDPIGHKWGEWEQTQAPTCTERGVETRVCSNDSSHTETRYTDALGHEWGEWEQIKAPTCTERGVEARVCARDGNHKETRYTDALGHEWGEAVYTWADDNANVKAKRVCQRDGTHELNETAYPSVTNTATCTEAGVKTFTAKFTSALFEAQTREVESEPLGHDYHDVAGTAASATCETAGRTADQKCSRCGDIIEGEPIEALGHDYHVVAGSAVAATCESDGKEADMKCSRCDSTKTGAVIHALGHDLVKTEAKAATCTVNGNIEYWTCNRCKKIFSDEAATTVITADDTIIKAAGHAWGEPVFTFSEGGGSATATRTCLTDPSHQETVDAVVTSEITKVATAEEMGEVTYTATALFDNVEYKDTKVVEANTYIPQSISQLSAVGDTNKIRLAWTRSHEVNSEVYCIYRREALSDKIELIKKINSREQLEYTDEDVVNEKKYTYYVTCLNAYGQESAPSPEATAMAMKDEEKPAVVQMSPAENAMIGGKQTISAKATDNVQVTSMILEISVDNGSSWTEIARSENSAISFELDTAAYESGEIKVRAVAYDGAGNVAEPFVSTYVIDNDGPSQVKNLTAEATAESVTLKWDDNPENDIKYFRVEQVTGSGEIKKIEDVNALGVILHGLKSSTEYTYQVTAYDILDNRGVTSERVTVTTASDDIAPSIVSIRPEPSFVSGNLEVTVTAKDNMGLASAGIQYSSDGLSWTYLDETQFEGAPAEATAKAVINTDDLEEGSLFVRAKVTDTSGNENDFLRMEPVEYKIDRTAPSKVTGLTAEAGSGSISLNWTASEDKDIRGYNVYRSVNGGQDELIAKAGKNSVVDHTANTAGTTYTYKVAAVDNAGNIGELSDAVSAEASADTEAPVINTFEPAAGSKIGPSKKTFAILISDNSALASAKITYTVDSKDGESDITEEQTLYENNAPGGYYVNVSGNIPVDNLADGDVVNIHVYAKDAAGNELAGSNNISYTIDKTAPAVYGLTAELKGQDVHLSISGERVADLKGYDIYRREAGGEREYIGTAEAGNATDADTFDHGEFTDTNTEAGKTYTYFAVAFDQCGNTSYRESEEVIIPDQVILNAKLTSDDIVEGDVEYYFSGIKSESNLGIKEFTFDFGDGSEPVTGESARVVHRYPEPALDDEDGTDTYTIRLTVTDNAGNTNTTERQVKVKRQALVGKVTVTVVRPDGTPISNVPVYFDMDRTLERVKTTDGKGQVQFVSDAGMYAIGAYTTGFLPIRRTMTVNANMENQITLTLTEKEIVTGKFEVSRLTLDEIRELGIDTSDPDNMHYARINVSLTYGEVEVVVDKYGAIKEWIKRFGQLDIFPHVKPDDKHVAHWPDVDDDDDDDEGGGVGFTNLVPEIPFVAILEVPVEASFLKEFFDVKLHLLNNATSEFEITDNTVSLDVPEGMTLLELEQRDGKIVNFDSLKGQESKTLDWCLRGDEAGDYTLTADYSGILRNFNTKVTGKYQTKPIHVAGLSAGKVIMEIDPYVQYGSFYTKISLQNVGDGDMYLPSIGIVDDLIHATEKYAGMNEEGETVELTDERDRKVRLLNEYLEDSSGYSQAIPPGGIEVLTKGQMISRRYACYDLIRKEDLVAFEDYCADIAEGYGIGFELIVRQHDLYDIEEGDAAAAKAKKEYILGSNGKSAYDWVIDKDNANFYYYIQNIMSRKDVGTNVGIEAHRVLSFALQTDLGVFTDEDKAEAVDKFIFQIINDDKFVEQAEERLTEEYLNITSTVIDWMIAELKTNENLGTIDMDDIEQALKTNKNRRKLAQAIRDGDPEGFRERAENIVSAAAPSLGSALVQKIFDKEVTTNEVIGKCNDTITTGASFYQSMIDKVKTWVGADTRSMEVYNRILTLRITKEQTDELLDIIMSAGKENMDAAVYNEVKKLKERLNDESLDQQKLFLKELEKAGIESVVDCAVDKVIAAMDKYFFAGTQGGVISRVRAILSFIFDVIDYLTGWGDSVEMARNIQVAGDLTKAVRKATTTAAEGTDAEHFLTCLKYLVKMRMLGEKNYIGAAQTEENNQGVLNMIKDDYKTEYEDLDEYYAVFKARMMAYRDSLFRDVEGSVNTPSAPEAGIDYAKETTLQTYSEEYEYSFGGAWKDCTGEAIQLDPEDVSRDLRIRLKANKEHPTGSSAFVAVPPRPYISGDAVCRYMNVKDTESVYIITGLPDGTYYYEFTDDVNLNKLSQDAATLTVTDGYVEIADEDNVKDAYLAVQRPATTDDFASSVRTIAAEEFKRGDINITEIPAEADTSEVPEEFADEASVVTAEADKGAMMDAAMQAAETSDVTAATALVQLKEELAGKEGSGVTDSTRSWEVKLIMETYIDMKVTEVKANEADSSEIKSIVVDITPMSRMIATTMDVEEIKVGTNAIQIGEAEKLDLSGQKTKLRIKLPASFYNESEVVYVMHHDEEYEAKITEHLGTGEIVIEFETDGFSPFRFSVEPATSISVGDVGYASMAAAIEAAKDGDTIVLRDDVTEAVTVTGKNLTINGGSHDANIVAGEKTEVTRTGSTASGDLVINVHYHVVHKVDAAPAGYNSPGHGDYWECSCGKKFTDETCTTEVPAEDFTPSLKDLYNTAASTATTDCNTAESVIGEANEMMAGGATGVETEQKIAAADSAADKAIESANAALTAAETALDAAKEELKADPDNDAKKAAVTEAEGLVAAAKSQSAAASSAKASAHNAGAQLAELKAAEATENAAEAAANAANQPKGTQEAVDAAQAALEAANEAQAAANAAKEAAQAAADAAKAAADEAKAAAEAKGVDPAEDEAYKAAEAAYNDAAKAASDAAKAADDAAQAVNEAQTALETAKNDKEAADAPPTPVTPGTPVTPVTPIVTPPAAPVEIIDLPAVKISKPKAAKGKLTVKWKKVSKKNQKKISGIQIQIATDPGFTNIVKTTTAGKKKTSKKISGLQKKTKYYIRIRAYGADNHYSVWKNKSGKTK